MKILILLVFIVIFLVRVAKFVREKREIRELYCECAVDLVPADGCYPAQATGVLIDSSAESCLSFDLRAAAQCPYPLPRDHDTVDWKYELRDFLYQTPEGCKRILTVVEKPRSIWPTSSKPEVVDIEDALICAVLTIVCLALLIDWICRWSVRVIAIAAALGLATVIYRSVT